MDIIKTLPNWVQISLIFVPVFSFLIAACAFAINVRQTVLSNRLGRSKIVSDCLHTFMNDDMMHRAFYKIEYGKFVYNKGFHTSDEEREIDKLLRHFSNLALIWKNGLLNLQDIHPIQYFILRVTNNPEVKKYLEFIDGWSNRAGTGAHPYVALNELTKKLNERKNV